VIRSVIATKSPHGMRDCFIVYLLLLFVSLPAQANSPEGPSLLNPSDYLKIMRAVIWVEKTTRFRAADSGRIRSCQEGLLRIRQPLCAEVSVGECGNVQHQLAYALDLQSVPREDLHFYQMTDRENGPGFLGPPAAPHAVLVLGCRDVNFLRRALFFDLTLVQFEESVKGLGVDAVGKEIVRGILAEGFWVATPERMLTYAKYFKKKNNSMGSPFLNNSHYPIDMSNLFRDYPYMSSESRDHAIEVGKVWNVDGASTLREIEAITQADIESRIRNGASF
jgi:hypothetical protein